MQFNEILEIYLHKISLLLLKFDFRWTPFILFCFTVLSTNYKNTYLNSKILWINKSFKGFREQQYDTVMMGSVGLCSEHWKRREKDILGNN